MKQDKHLQNRIKILRLIYYEQIGKFSCKPVQIHSSMLKTTVKEYNKYLPELRTEGFVFCDDSYQVKRRSKAYQLNFKKLLSTGLIYELGNGHFKDDRLDHCLSQCRSFENLMIDFEAININDPLMFHALAIDANIKFLNRSCNCKRVYSNIVTLPRVYRRNLRAYHYNLAISDISCTFPLFLGKYIPNSLEKLLFIDLVQTGGFYEYIQKYGYDKPITREKIKKGVIQVISASPVDHPHLESWKSVKAFKRCFPIVYKAIINLHQHTNSLSCDFQKLEAKIMIDTVIPELLKSHPDLYHLSLHDALIYPVQYQEEVEQIIKEGVYMYTGVCPKVKTELLRN